MKIFYDYFPHVPKNERQFDSHTKSTYFRKKKLLNLSLKLYLKTIPNTLIFLSKLADHQVTLTSFPARLPQSRKTPFVSMREIDRGRKCKVWQRYLSCFFVCFFLVIEGKGRECFASPNGTRTKAYALTTFCSVVACLLI